MLHNLENKVGQSISGVVLMRGYKVQMTKTNKEYIVGEIQNDVSVSFKAWGNSSAFEVLRSGQFENVPVAISGTVDSYQGIISIVIETVAKAADTFTIDQFLPTRYNIDAYYNALVDYCQKNLSPSGYQLLNSMLFGKPELVERFKLEFAAKSFHDNCKGGLLAHTYKCLMLLNYTLKQYPTILNVPDVEEQDVRDLYIIGVVLHDIGKTVEMNTGVYQFEGCITHNIIGLDFLDKAAIVEQYGEKWYTLLVSIITQHHDGLGGGLAARTVCAFVVHTVDLFEARLAFMSEKVPDATSGAVLYDGRNMVV